MIPLKDKVTIIHSAGFDDWGDVIVGTSISHPCRLSTVTEKVINQNGDEAVTKGSVLMKGYVEVQYGDVLSFTEQNGVTVATENPVSIQYKKDLVSVVMFTKVSY